MNNDDRIDELERQVEQLQHANEMMFNLILTFMLHEKWSFVTPQDASDYIRIMAGGQEDQENHIAAAMLERLSDKLKIADPTD